MFKDFPGRRGMLVIGLIIGLGAAVLAYVGNPPNMALCAACFIRDIAGALGLQQTAVVQYLRPEILGIIVGATIMAVLAGEFKPASLNGLGLVIRFFLGVVMMIGSLIFLGCPLRMILRLAAGDLNAVTGLLGFLGGILTATFFLKRGFTLGETKSGNTAAGSTAASSIVPGLIAVLMVLAVATPAVFFRSESGPGSMHGPVAVSLGIGLLIGVLCQRGAVCTSGSLRDLFLTKDGLRVYPLAVIFGVMLVYNLAMGKFMLGFGNTTFVQPIAHSNHLWNFLGLYTVGFAAVLAVGCPLRQMVLVGQGSLDGAATFLGLLLGAAFVHRLGLAAGGNTLTEGVLKIGVVPTNGKIALICCIIFLFIIAAIFSKKSPSKNV